MGSSILGIGQSALNAAQAGLTTTGHNIANVNTPGYSRQVVVQSAAAAQNIGSGFIGKGTEVVTVKRMYNEFLNNQVLSSQVASSASATYSSQIKQIDNLLADPTAGVSPAIQDFFDGLQDVASNPSSSASRQAMLSSAEALAARFQSVGTRLDELRQGVNTQITTSINLINGYAQQIANLNDAIEKAQGSAGESKPANDLLDQRDQIIAELSKETKVTVVKQGNSYNVFIGNGQGLTVGTQTFKLVPAQSPNDPSKIQVGYNGADSVIADSSLPGGKLGGLLEFRSNTLDPAQNALGRVAIGLATTFNDQHRLGQDRDGNIGNDFFTAATPEVNASSKNNQTAPIASISAAISDVDQLTTSDYTLRYDGTNYIVTRLSDSTSTSYASFALASTGIEGVTLTNDPGSVFTAGDEFLIRPTSRGATEFAVEITDIADIAAAAPIRTAAATGNTGTGKISTGTVNGPPPTNVNLQQPVTIRFTSATTFDVSYTATGTAIASGVTLASSGNISYNGWTAQITGTPANGDTFTVAPNTNGVGDNRNALLLGALQTSNTLGNGSMSYQGAYTYMVSEVGNKSRELEVTSRSEEVMLEQAIEAREAESGVNLDEEAANLMRYQQAYQAAAKVMQTAGQLFELLLTLGT